MRILKAFLSFLFVGVLGGGGDGNRRLGGIERRLGAEERLRSRNLRTSKMLLWREPLIGERECLESLYGEALLLSHKLWLEAALLLKLPDLLWSELLRS